MLRGFFHKGLNERSAVGDQTGVHTNDENVGHHRSIETTTLG